MADDTQQLGPNIDPGAGAEGNLGGTPGGQGAPATAPKPASKRAGKPPAALARALADPDILAPGKPGRPRTNHGPAAQARRDADTRAAARKALKAENGGQLPPGAPVAPKEPRPSVAGYSRRIVKTHKMAAAALDMPELELDREEARDLEECVTEYLSMKGIPIRTQDRVTFDLVWCVVSIYGPILIAVVRRFVMPPKPKPQLYQGGAAGPQVQPAQPMAPPSVEPAPFVFRPPPVAPVRTENKNPGFPETERTIFSDGTTASGLLFNGPAQGGLEAI